MSGGRRAVVFGALALAACATGVAEEPLRVTLSDVGVEDIQFLEQRYRLAVRFQNPNGVDYDVNGMSFVIELNGAEFARGVSDQRFVIPRFGEQVVQVTALGTANNLMRQMMSMATMVERGGASWRINGRAGVTGRITPLAFSGESVIDLEPP